MPDAAPEDTAWLTAYLAGRAVHCPICSRPLDDLVGDACPHCKSPLTLTLGTVEPYLRAWIALAVATCASSGVGALIIAVLLDEGPPPRRLKLLYWSVWFFAFSTPVGPLVVATRRRFLRVSATAQRRLAVSGICAVVLAAVAFIVGIKFQ